MAKPNSRGTVAVPCCRAVIKGHRVWDPVLQRVLALTLMSALQFPGKRS